MTTRRVAALLAALALCAYPARAMAEASTFCVYALLIESHLMTTKCGEPLDSAAEQRYRILLSAFRENIIENARGPHNSHAETTQAMDGYEAKLKARHAADEMTVCQTSNYADAARMLKSFTSEKGTEALLKVRDSHKDPMDGDCL